MGDTKPSTTYGAGDTEPSTSFSQDTKPNVALALLGSPIGLLLALTYPAMRTLPQLNLALEGRV